MRWPRKLYPSAKIAVSIAANIINSSLHIHSFETESHKKPIVGLLTRTDLNFWQHLTSYHCNVIAIVFEVIVCSTLLSLSRLRDITL